MKNLNKKSAALLIAVAVLLLATISGTLAYLTDRTEAVTNTFAPTQVKTEIEEDFDGKIKSSIVIKNDAKSIKVYIRVALVGNWVNKDGQITRPWDGTFTLGENWVKSTTDGYYYYTKPVEAGDSTTDLLGSSIEATTENGETLVITVIHQAVQAEGIEATSAQDAFAKAAK